MNQVSHVFGSGKAGEDGGFKDCPDDLDREDLILLAEICDGEGPHSLFEKADKFQTHTTRVCFPDGGQPTKINYMGVVAMSEAVSRECGGLALDLLFKYDILRRTSDGEWVLTPDWEEKRIYVVGDVKTADNIDKFIHDLLGRGRCRTLV